MKRIVIWFMSTLSAVVLLLSYKTSTGEAVSVASSLHPAAPTTTAGTASSGGTATSADTASSAAAAAESGTFVGTAVDTRYGPVQVQITVANGKITDVQAIEYPMNDHRDVEINSRAIPALNAEAMAAQSAKIDAVSGATWTSGGYLTSLQSALDQAGI